MARRKLRDLSRQEVTQEEFGRTLAELDAPHVPDMIAAVLAASLVEYQLEQVLKRNFRRTDATSWGRMTDGSGPLRDFHSKIVTGYALSSFDEDIRVNLNIIREIRNAFAHSRVLLTFDHADIGAALNKARPVTYGKRVLRSGTLALDPSKRAYLDLCMSLLMFFQLKLYGSLKRKERRIRSNEEAHTFLQKLIAAEEQRKPLEGA